jgi:hypothetical protein
VCAHVGECEDARECGVYINACMHMSVSRCIYVCERVCVSMCVYVSVKMHASVVYT